MLSGSLVQLTNPETMARDFCPGVPRVLVADTNPAARAAIDEALAGLGERLVTHAATRDELMRLYFEEGPFDLVVCRSDLGTRSGLLTKARKKGRTGSFIVYSDVGPWFRVFVCDCGNTVLSSRVVALDSLCGLATGMLEASRAAELTAVRARA